LWVFIFLSHEFFEVFICILDFVSDIFIQPVNMALKAFRFDPKIGIECARITVSQEQDDSVYYLEISQRNEQAACQFKVKIFKKKNVVVRLDDSISPSPTTFALQVTRPNGSGDGTCISWLKPG